MADPPRSPTSDFYSIFGIHKTSSLKELCNKSYKSIVTKWYPDHKSPSHKTNPESEVEASINSDIDKDLENGKKQDEKFKENEDPWTPKGVKGGHKYHKSVDDSFFSRHSFLSRSSSKRSHTPSRSSAYLSKSESRRRSTSDTEIPSISRSGSSVRRSTTPIIFSQSTARRKPPPVEKTLECTLEELCDGCVKMIKISREVITDAGLIVQEEEVLKIKLKPGWRKGTKITFEGKGDEKPGYLPADIIFSIDEKRHSLFDREGDDLILIVEIPLVEALTGCSVTVPLLGGEKMSLSFDDIIHPEYEKVIRGQGMPNPKEEGKRGDLRIKFLVDFPVELSEEQRTDASAILQDCS